MLRPIVSSQELLAEIYDVRNSAPAGWHDRVGREASSTSVTPSSHLSLGRRSTKCQECHRTKEEFDEKATKQVGVDVSPWRPQVGPAPFAKFEAILEMKDSS